MNLDRVLEDLHAERQWLDTMIGAVELVSNSPSHRLIRKLDRSLGRNGSARIGLRLDHQQRAALLRLAHQVRADKPRAMQPARVVEFAAPNRRQKPVAA